jgi:hypothetical protein
MSTGVTKWIPNTKEREDKEENIHGRVTDGGTLSRCVLEGEMRVCTVQ